MAKATTAHLPWRRFGRRAGALALGAGIVLAGAGFRIDPAAAQSAGSTITPSQADSMPWVGVPARPSSSSTATSQLLSQRKTDPNAQMLVQANEINYDYSNERVAAVGQVQIHYSGSVLEADRVVYDQKNKRLHAAGNVRLTEADGKVVHTDLLDLTDDFRDGFVDSLHIETIDKTRFAGARAERSAGRFTVFQSGVYTACEPCKDNPQRPPKWQVKGARIIHDETEKMVYFEDARLEFFGFPVAYLPYFWTPDPTVKRKSGLLVPRILSGTKYGLAVEIPYFWALAPDYDITLTPTPTTRQGMLMQAEWRQRLVNGSYFIRGAGIFQSDKEVFAGQTGERDFRGGIETGGQFRVSDKWVWGWDATAVTDPNFSPDYKVTKPGATEAVSQLYLTGRGARSYFDARFMHFYGFSSLDVQKQLPIIHPVVDYSYVFDKPILGGEVGYNFNLTSLSRQDADFDPITASAARTIDSTTGALLFPADGKNICDTADPAAVRTRADCLLRGIPGTYSRASGEAYWRRTFIDPFGQVFTPFVRVRADVAAASIRPQPGVGEFIQTGDSSMARVMPAVGVEYRYPLISVHSWGTQTLEPIAQLIMRPNETQIDRFANEDSQSLIFDDANLFKISKFSGWDRVEGGTRANVGLQYSAQINGAGYLNGLFGQSYQLFGTNSYALADMSNAGLQSGLETPRSDYVARMTYQPNKIYSFTSRFRFDEENFAMRRMELEGKANFDRWNVGLLYGQYDAQPLAGLLDRREGILGSAGLKLTQNWSVGGSALYSIDASRLNTASFSLGYIDECIAIALSYTANYGYAADIVPNSTLMVQITLRTLGGTAVNQTVGGPGGEGKSFFSQ
jgi:LPS-assembly protein